MVHFYTTVGATGPASLQVAIQPVHPQTVIFLHRNYADNAACLTPQTNKTLKIKQLKCFAQIKPFIVIRYKVY